MQIWHASKGSTVVVFFIYTNIYFVMKENTPKKCVFEVVNVNAVKMKVFNRSKSTLATYLISLKTAFHELSV